MNVLDRMVERAYGTLPSVAPLLRSGAQSGATFPVATEDGLRIEHAHRANPLAEARPRGPSTHPAHRRDPEPVVDGIRPGWTVPGDDSADPERTVRRGKSRDDDPSLPGGPGGRSDERTQVPSPVGEGPGLPGSFPAGFPLVSPSPAAKGGREDTWEHSIATPPPDARFETVPVRNRTQSRTTQQLDAPRPIRSENVVADRHPAPTEPEPPPEIHITIGRIELRGPRSESKPVPPFRPRVSLDELLGRASGSGR